MGVKTILEDRKGIKFVHFIGLWCVFRILCLYCFLIS